MILTEVIRKTEDHHFGIPCFVNIDLGDILKQKNWQRDDEYEFVHTVDKCLIKKSDSPEKYPRSRVRKIGTVTFRQKIRLSIKRKPP